MNLNKINILVFILSCCSIQMNNCMYGGKAITPEELSSIRNMQRVNEGLINASQKGDYKAAEKAISEGANVNYIENGRTPLYFAALNNHLDIVKLLVEKGADIDLRKANFPTPLIIAAMEGNLHIVKFLLNNGAGINLTYDHGINFKNMDAIKIAEIYDHHAVADYIEQYKARRAKEVLDGAPLALVLVDLVEEYEGYKSTK